MAPCPSENCAVSISSREEVCGQGSGEGSHSDMRPAGFSLGALIGTDRPSGGNGVPRGSGTKCREGVTGCAFRGAGKEGFLTNGVWGVTLGAQAHEHCHQKRRWRTDVFDVRHARAEASSPHRGVRCGGRAERGAGPGARANSAPVVGGSVTTGSAGSHCSHGRAGHRPFLPRAAASRRFSHAGPGAFGTPGSRGQAVGSGTAAPSWLGFAGGKSVGCRTGFCADGMSSGRTARVRTDGSGSGVASPGGDVLESPLRPSLVVGPADGATGRSPRQGSLLT